MAEVLAVDRLSAGYGPAIVLSDVSFTVPQGGAVAILGRNGTGKTTLINTLVGLTTYRSGSIRLAGVEITGMRPEQRAAAGIGWVPQERNVFRSLTVEENLTSVARPGRWTVAEIYRLFPRLKERRHNMGSQLSGGEQQMLAVGRALALNPRLLLLDEPLEGLAPVIIDELLAALRRVMADEGLSALVVEQKARKILPFTTEAIIFDRGTIVHRGPSQELLDRPDLLHARIGVSHASQSGSRKG